MRGTSSFKLHLQVLIFFELAIINDELETRNIGVYFYGLTLEKFRLAKLL